MKRFYYAMLSITLVLFVSCQADPGDERDASRLGKMIWDEARLDVEFVLSAMVDVLNVDFLLSIEDEESRVAAFSKLYGQNMELETIDADKGEYRICARNISTGDVVSYTTYKTNNLSLSEGEWQVKRVSGDGYTISFTPTSDGSIRALCNPLYHVESKGFAELVFTYSQSLTSGLPTFVIDYEGKIEMVDREMSNDRPLTLTTETTNISRYSTKSGIIDSWFVITCKDEYYDVTDKISAKVIYNTQRSVEVTCYGETDIYIM